MRRLLPVMVLAMLFGVGALATPPCASACSCAPPRPLAEYMQDPGAAVFAGRAGPRTPEAVAFVVGRWYGGPGAASMLTLSQEGIGMCGLAVESGVDMILVATRRAADGRFEPSICLPFARVGTAEGDRLTAEAVALFGPGYVPTPAPTQPPSPVDPVDDWSLTGAILLLVAGGASLLAIVAALVLVSRRRPSGE
jgi:hypothetical protein